MQPDSTASTIKIGIADDHPLTRFALRSLIEARPDWKLCCECESPSELMAFLTENKLDAVVIDLSFGEESGLDVLQELRDLYPLMRSLVYSGNCEQEYANRCFRLGASGYVSKEEPVENVQSAIDCVVKGFGYVSEKLIQSTVDSAANNMQSSG